MKSDCFTIWVFGFWLTLLSHLALAEHAQYIVFNRAPESVWNQQHPETIRKKHFLDFQAAFEGAQTGSIRAGICFIFSYFKSDRESVTESLERFLRFAQETDTPVVVKLDGEQWWQNRPDLWNWWDPNRPGYHPDNRKNVEWTGWGEQYAVKIGWRKWGPQVRVEPHPNLMSSRYREACEKEMRHLIPIVLEWYRGLSDHQKHLFIGINLGWESSIGTSNYYYPNGNDLLDKPPSEDPTYAAQMEDVLSRGQVQLGYAALTSSGIRTQGDITEDDLVEVTRRHLYHLCQIAADLGVPREKLTTHGVGNYKGEKLYDAAVNRFSCPGWSTYVYAEDPTQDPGIMRNIQRSDAPYWAAVEWLLLKPLNDSQAYANWYRAIRNTLAAPKLKFMIVYNWETVSSSPDVMRAFDDALSDRQPHVRQQ